MEFLRFGSSIPGSYWGCCAVCIIQDFKQDPDEKASIELVDGDGGAPIGGKFCGPTYRDIFNQRLRIGTFNGNDMPNHGFLAILTDWQLDSTIGSKWLKILKENGFEFIRTVDNSVYSGSSLKGESCDDDDCYDDEDSCHLNYIFGLFRNIGNGAVRNPFQPPQQWLDLEGGVDEMFSRMSVGDCQDLQLSRDRVHLESWNKIGPVKFMTREQLEEQKVPVWLAGRRSTNPQEKAKWRETRQKSEAQPVAAPFGAAKVAVPVAPAPVDF